MQHFLICDDSPQDAAALADLLRQTAGDCEIRTALTAEEAQSVSEGQPFSALFLDIELDGSSGISFAQAYAKAFPQTALVFYTAHIRYCEEIFTAAPDALLIKPLTAERVRGVLDILEKKQPQKGYLMLAAGKNTARRIPLEEIAYIEIIRRRLTVFDTGGRAIAECYGRKLSEIAPQLGSEFVCCHQSIYVNMRHVAAIRRYMLVLRSGQELPISQSKFRTVREQWGEYLGESL